MTTTEPKRPSYKLFVAIVLTVLLLLVGALLFFGRGEEITLALPVRFTGIPHELLVAADVPVLEARLSGRSRLLKGLKDMELTHEIDLTSAKPGTLLIEVSPETIKVPRGVSVLEVHPASFTISIDKRKEKLVPVEPDLRNDPAAGYIVSKVVASPSTIKLTGPAGVLEKISALRTTPIDLAGLTEPTKKKVALNLNRNPYVHPVGDRLVEVEIVVEEKIAERWMDIRVQVTSTKYTYEITPEWIKLLIRGPVNTIKRLAQGHGIRVYVDLKGLKPGMYIHPAVIDPPLNTTLLEAKPEVFTVQLFE